MLHSNQRISEIPKLVLALFHVLILCHTLPLKHYVFPYSAICSGEKNNHSFLSLGNAFGIKKIGALREGVSFPNLFSGGT